MRSIAELEVCIQAMKQTVINCPAGRSTTAKKRDTATSHDTVIKKSEPPNSTRILRSNAPRAKLRSAKKF